MNKKPLLGGIMIFTLGGVVGYSATFLSPQFNGSPESQVISDKNASGPTQASTNIVSYKDAAPGQVAITNPFSTEGNASTLEDVLVPAPLPVASAEQFEVITPTQLENYAVHTLNSELNKEIVSDLVASLANVTGDDGTNLELQASTELKFLSEIEKTPEIVEPLLATYAELADPEVKEFLGSMLTASGDYRVEVHAINKALGGDPAMQTQWLELLSNTGVKSSETRDQLMQAMGGFIEPDKVALALQAITYEPMPSDEKWQVVNQLQQYASHENTEIKIAGIKALSRWVDKGQTGFIEDAISDESLYVRQAAIYAANTAGIQSGAIKSDLMRIMKDEDESFTLRMDAYDALSNYSLQTDEYELLHHFHKEVESLNEDAGLAKG